MRKYGLHIIPLVVFFLGCRHHEAAILKERNNANTLEVAFDIPSRRISGGGALLLTDFKSMEEFKKVVSIEYKVTDSISARAFFNNPEVRLSHHKGKQKVLSVLSSGINEKEIIGARQGSIWDKFRLAFMSPYTIYNVNDLFRVEFLSRRRYLMFGKGDVAFYDLAEAMVQNIREDDLNTMTPEEVSEKGYLNTFNHITGQAFITSMFSEDLADFVADAHERNYLPELISGNFTTEQISDINNGAVDNYLDMINNEWGQELGKELQKKYSIQRNSHWSPELLANYLNDIQNYYSWTMKVGFKPFKPNDEKVVRFATKINTVMKGTRKLRAYYKK